MLRKILTGALFVTCASCAPQMGTFPVFSATNVVAPSAAPASIRVGVDFEGSGYSIRVENTGAETVVFRWDLASFISTDGVSGFLLPGTTRMIELNQAPRSEPVPSGGTLLRVAVPVWEGDVTDPAGLRFDSPCDDIIGRPVRLTLPVETGGTVHEYRASFEVESVLMRANRRGRIVTKRCPD